MESDAIVALVLVIITLGALWLGYIANTKFITRSEKSLEELIEQAKAGKEGTLKMEFEDSLDICEPIGAISGCYGNLGVEPSCEIKEGTYFVKVFPIEEDGVCINFTKVS